MLPGPLSGALDPAHRLQGERTDDCRRRHHGPGDVDGDGVADVLVGAWGHDTVGVFGGRAYVMLGPVTEDAALADAEVVLDGADTWDVLGFAVGPATSMAMGTDIAVGAYGHDAGGLSAVPPGCSPTRWGCRLADAIASIEGEGTAAGWSLDGAGDTNGDGFTDVVVGAPGPGAAARCSNWPGHRDARDRRCTIRRRGGCRDHGGRRRTSTGMASMTCSSERPRPTVRRRVAWLLHGIGGRIRGARYLPP